MITICICLAIVAVIAVAHKYFNDKLEIPVHEIKVTLPKGVNVIKILNTGGKPYRIHKNDILVRNDVKEHSHYFETCTPFVHLVNMMNWQMVGYDNDNIYVVYNYKYVDYDLINLTETDKEALKVYDLMEKI